MKPMVNYLLLFVFFISLFTLKAQAQKPMAKEGFWVVESNVATPQKATVYFYNAQHQLVYKEDVTNLQLNLAKAKVRRHLNVVLQQSVTAWRRENNQLLANRML